MPELARSAPKLQAFAALIIEMQGKAEAMELDRFYDTTVCSDSGYLAALEQKNDVESRTRAENVKELKSSIVEFIRTTHPDGSQSVRLFGRCCPVYRSGRSRTATKTAWS